MKEKKEEIRKQVLGIRNNLHKEKVVEWSSKIIQKLYSLKEYKESSFIMTYVDFKNEVITKELILQSFKLGKRVAVPVMCYDENKNGQIKISEISDYDKDLAKGSFGILEPICSNKPFVNENMIDFIVVPGVGFDINGQRIGFGKGFYDSFFERIGKQCPKVGLAYEFQVFDALPCEKHDVPLDMIITEKRVIDISSLCK